MNGGLAYDWLSAVNLERVLVSEANRALRAFTWSNSYNLAVLVEDGISKDQLNDVLATSSSKILTFSAILKNIEDMTIAFKNMDFVLLDNPL